MSTAATASTVALDAVVWAVWSTVVGYTAHRLPVRRLARDTVVTRLRRWEDEGRVYERLRIRSWKDRLPELGAVFRGGVSKRSVRSRATVDLERFAVETRRAELVHWAIPLVTPVFVLWNPPGLLVAMAAYAVVANLPCLLVQRYNRGRLLRLIAHRTARTRTAPAGAGVGAGPS
jgi:glycosyl-4,4'-diaponeurosporenoate acyltransferase